MRHLEMIMKHNGKLLPLLRRDPLFAVLSEEELTDLIDDPRCHQAVYRSGEVVYTDGSFRRALGLVLTGKVDVYRLGSGAPVLLQQLQEGALFGAAALFSGEERYVTTLTARTDAAIFFLPSEVCEELITTHPAFALGYIRFLSDRIRFLNRRLAAFAAPAVEQKVAGYLLRTEGQPTMSRVRLASALGIGRASLYRVLDDFEARGLIAKDGKSLRLIDPEGLRRLL